MVSDEKMIFGEKYFFSVFEICFTLWVANGFKQLSLSREKKLMQVLGFLKNWLIFWIFFQRFWIKCLFRSSKFLDFSKNPMIFLSKIFNFYLSDPHKNWKSFFNDPETFISAILASWAKIRVTPAYHFSNRIFQKSKMAANRFEPPMVVKLWRN